MAQFEHLVPPAHSERIVSDDPKLLVPDHPLIPFFTGDGEWRDRWPLLQEQIDAAVHRAYGDKKSIDWFAIEFGEQALARYASKIPDDSLEALRTYVVALLGPVQMEQKKRIAFDRSLRDAADLSLCLRPLTMTKSAQDSFAVSFFELLVVNDLCEGQQAGIRFSADSKEAQALLDFARTQLREKRIRYPASSSLSLQTYSLEASTRLLRGVKHIVRQHAVERIYCLESEWADPFTSQLRQAFAQQPNLAAQSNFIRSAVLWPRLRQGEKKPPLLIGRDDVAEQILAMLAGQMNTVGINAMARINVDSGHAIFGPCCAFLPDDDEQNGNSSANFDVTATQQAQPEAMLSAAAMMLRHIGWEQAASQLLKKLAQAG